MEAVSNLIHGQIVQPFTEVLQGGITNEALGRSLCLGVVGGLFPVPGSTVLVCILLNSLFGGNIVIIQVVNFALTPVELLAIPVFARILTAVARLPPIELPPLSKLSMRSLLEFSTLFVRAILGWTVTSPILLLIYPLSLAILAICRPTADAFVPMPTPDDL